ncbi:hypothetical protein [Citricoccus sp. GCM10030269]|uniref:hypothetical protein n=1 Tax=Citricoccus sp. GCM10030269 TaxID=3273388 RepID=UPI003607D435
MTDSFDRTCAELRARGTVTLPGRPSTWTRVLTVLMTVLLVMVAGLVVAGIITLLVVSINGVAVHPVGFAVPLMLAGLGWLLLRAFRSHRAFATAQTLPVTLSPQGFTVRGIGPVPWHDVQPPAHHLVPSQHDSGYERRAAMALSPSGLRNVAALSREQRKLLGPVKRSIFARSDMNYIYVPDAEGLSTDETMQLFRTAHEMFTRGAAV